jgi:hypothetical protein
MSKLRRKMDFTMLLTALLFACSYAAPSTDSKFKLPVPFNYISASRTKEHVSSMEKRAIGGVRLATGKNFTGQVWYGNWGVNDCIDLGGL